MCIWTLKMMIAGTERLLSARPCAKYIRYIFPFSFPNLMKEDSHLHVSGEELEVQEVWLTWKQMSSALECKLLEGRDLFLCCKLST